jgi:hypothetical protein
MIVKRCPLEAPPVKACTIAVGGGFRIDGKGDILIRIDKDSDPAIRACWFLNTTICKLMCVDNDTLGYGQELELIARERR